MKLLPLYALLLIGLFTSTNCKKVPSVSESTCIGAANDGSIRLKAWGYGRTNIDAIQNAKKNAVQEVLFKGIKAGAPGCPTRPIVDDISKRESAYFREFFSYNGPYLQYVNLSDKDVTDRLRISLFRLKVGMYVVVDHRALKKRMEEDKQTKSLGTGF